VPLASVIEELAELVELRRAEAALAAIDDLLPAWGLCPRVHFFAGQAAEMLGDADDVELNRFLTATCLRGILLSGRGTRRSPYVVAYPSDVLDVLAAKRLTAKSQTLVEGAGTRLDGISTHEGPTVWFDVGEMLAACAKSQRRSVRRKRAVARG
jgi:hypothetical protein